MLSGRTPYDVAKDPADVYMLYDGTGSDSQSNATYSAPLGLDGFEQPLADFKHFDGANYAFMDGHVKWRRKPAD